MDHDPSRTLVRNLTSTIISSRERTLKISKYTLLAIRDGVLNENNVTFHSLFSWDQSAASDVTSRIQVHVVAANYRVMQAMKLHVQRRVDVRLCSSVIGVLKHAQVLGAILGKTPNSSTFWHYSQGGYCRQAFCVPQSDLGLPLQILLEVVQCLKNGFMNVQILWQHKNHR